MQIFLCLKLTSKQMFDLGSAFPHFIGRRSHLGLCSLDLIHSTALIDVGKGCYKLLLRRSKRNQMFMYNYAFVQSRGRERAETVKRKSAFFHLGTAARWTDKDEEGRHQGLRFPSHPSGRAVQGANKSQIC